MRSPAEAYAQARTRAAHPELGTFVTSLSFELDDFQRRSCLALEEGHGVLVCAPTGAGKTVVGEFAVHLALGAGPEVLLHHADQGAVEPEVRRPRRAARRRRGRPAHRGHRRQRRRARRRDDHRGAAQHALRRGARARRARLRRDGRGALPRRPVPRRRVGGGHPPPARRTSGWPRLSATVSNAEEFGDWLVEVRGDTTVVVDEHRPVPLWQHMIVGLAGCSTCSPRSDGAAGDEPREGRPDAREGRAEVDREAAIRRGRSGPPPRRGRDGSRRRNGRRDDRGAGPRRGPGRSGSPAARRRGSTSSSGSTRPGCCPRSRSSSAGPAATPPSTSACAPGCGSPTPRRSTRSARSSTAPHRDLPDARPRRAGLLGVARGASSAASPPTTPGCCPAFKETVEELFVRGLVKAVFATETLALGINMPARTVVLERLVKYNGEAHVELTPGEYTQLTGRAGRRGIDVEGHAVVLWAAGHGPRAGRRARLHPHLPAALVVPAGLQHGRQPRRPAGRSRRPASCSSSRSRSSRPTARWSHLAKRVERNREALEGYAEAMAGEGGGESPRRVHRVRGPAAAAVRAGAPGPRSRGAGAEGRGRGVAGGAAQAATSSPCPAGKRAGLAVVLDPGVDRPARTEPRPLVLTEDRWAGRLSVTDFPAPVHALGRIRLPEAGRPRGPRVAPRPGGQRCATPASRRRGRARRRPGRGRRRGARDPAPRPARAPVPRLRAPRGPRPLGRAPLPAGRRERPARAAGGARPPTRWPGQFDRIRACSPSAAT